MREVAAKRCVPPSHSGNRQPSDAWRVHLSDNMVALRHSRGWTQLELAAACGCQRTFISNLEQGLVNPTLATLEMLAEGFDCAAADLLAGCYPAAPTPREPGTAPALLSPES